MPDSPPFSRTNMERPGVFLDVADQPIIAVTATVGEIVTAHRLGLARETAANSEAPRAISRRFPLADARQRIALHHLGENRRARRVGRDKHPQLP